MSLQMKIKVHTCMSRFTMKPLFSLSLFLNNFKAADSITWFELYIITKAKFSLQKYKFSAQNTGGILHQKPHAQMSASGKRINKYDLLRTQVCVFYCTHFSRLHTPYLNMNSLISELFHSFIGKKISFIKRTLIIFDID